MMLAVYLAILIGLAVRLRQPDMKQWLDPQWLGAMGRQLLDTPLGPLAVVGAYVLAVLLGLPVLVLVMMGAIIFPPWPGIFYILMGMLAGALVTYGIGRFTGAQTMDRWTQGRLALVAKHLQRRGLSTVILLRLMPVAPFIIVNMVAGALRVRLRDYVPGTVIGQVPITVLVCLFLDRLTEAWRTPSPGSYALLVAMVLLLAVVFWWMRKRFKRVPH
jgi:uncharacterized membrane protein YdjX (TVP38/TMEM64 family)